MPSHQDSATLPASRGMPAPLSQAPSQSGQVSSQPTQGPYLSSQAPLSANQAPHPSNDSSQPPPLASHQPSQAPFSPNVAAAPTAPGKPPAALQPALPLAQQAPIPRNVSFANDSSESTAYREHNPPAVLRRQEAARREMSPHDESRRQSLAQIAPTPATTGGAAKTTAGPSAASVPGRSGTPTSIISPRSSPYSDGRANSQCSAPAHQAPQVTTDSGNAPAPQGIIQNHHRKLSHTGAQPDTRGDHLKVVSAKPEFVIRPEPRTLEPSKPDARKQESFKQESLKHESSKQDLRRSDGRPGPETRVSGKNLDPKLTETGNKSEEVHILVAVTGSVATIKLPLIVHKLKQIYRKRAVINVVVTKASTIFFDRQDLPKDVKVWYDSDEWRSREASVSGHVGASVANPGSNTSATTNSDQQLHIRLRRWADILLVAPCSANTLAKLTYGICDNLLTSIFRVWNPEVPILLAPAMNTHMYTNPVTKRHFNIIKESYPFVEILRPVEKVLVCGDIGMGGMREWNDIVQVLVKRVGVSLESESEEEDETD